MTSCLNISGNVDTPYHANLYPKGRVFFVGDIHGCFTELMVALRAVAFSPASGDIVVSVGDLVDKGKESIKVLQLLRRKWFKCAMGNHEEMMVNAITGEDVASQENWMLNGGMWYVKLSSSKALVADDMIRKYVQHLPYAITVHLDNGKSIGVVHGDTPEDGWNGLCNKLSCQKYRKRVLWGRRTANKAISLLNKDGASCVDIIKGVDAVLLGHTSMKEGPLVSGNTLFIDTDPVYTKAIVLIEARRVIEMTSGNRETYQECVK
jgi:serine/threonine protein phosphatase 1